jgi:NADPH-dependent 2,4-dienoyl-CoA reductase/sulfur reductase-like enzyme
MPGLAWSFCTAPMADARRGIPGIDEFLVKPVGPPQAAVVPCPAKDVEVIRQLRRCRLRSVARRPPSLLQAEERRRIMRSPKIAIIGAGMGGMAAAGTLRQAGIEVEIYEQAHQFGRIGAGIQMLPNSMKVLRGLGVEAMLRERAFAPYSHLNRVGDTGELKRELPMPEELYGAPFLCMHRADLHDALTSIVCRPRSSI